MFSFYKKADNHIKIDNKTYLIKDSFDNILKLIDLMNNQKILEKNKLKLGIEMLFGKDTDILNYELSEQREIFIETFNQIVKKDKNSQEYDLEGNLLPNTSNNKENYYSFKYDSEYIYASFYQAYRIDLIEQQGELSWNKFLALLGGLPEDTKFRQVVSIRTWEKPKKNYSETKKMKELQRLYKLPEDERGGN